MGAGVRPSVHQSNGFDALRLIAAVLVLYGHSAYLTGHDPVHWYGNALSTIGVKVFFVISGYFICRSWAADPAPARFARRRMLRIWPALFVCIAATMVLGALVSAAGPATYLASAGTRTYLLNLVFYPVYYLPGVFAQNVYPGAVNGSLWSLQVEVLMYLGVPFVLGAAGSDGRIPVVVAALLSAALSLYCVASPQVVLPARFGMSLRSLLDVCVYFQIGAAYAVFGLQRFARPFFSVAAILALSLLLSRLAGVPGVLEEGALMLLLPYAVISVGMMHSERLRPVFATGDFSYGLYLYGFPIQQALVWGLGGGRGGAISTATDFALALPLTFACAVLSWRLVERRALKWKPKRG